MAEQLTQKPLLTGVFGTGSYIELAELQSGQAPEANYRGDTLPTSPRDWATWYVSTASSGAGPGELYYYDPGRGAWFSVRQYERQFHFTDASAGSVGTATVDPKPMSTVFGVASGAGHGYPLVNLPSIVGASKHVLTLARIQAAYDADAAPSSANLTALLALDGDWPTPVGGGGASIQIPGPPAAYMSGELLAKNVEFAKSAGNLITAAMVVPSGTTNYGANMHFYLSAWFQRKIEA